ncbi:MAG: hypothetical protein WC496_04795 [Phycisphaerae bacterium]|jgi:hypothetical protein
MNTTERKLPITRPSMMMFQPYKQNIKCCLIVTLVVIGLIIAVQLFLWIK